MKLLEVIKAEVHIKMQQNKAATIFFELQIKQIQNTLRKDFCY